MYGSRGLGEANSPKAKAPYQKLLINIYRVLDRTKVLYGPRTQTYGETNYLDEKTEFWTESRYCMVLGLKPMGKSTT